MTRRTVALSVAVAAVWAAPVVAAPDVDTPPDAQLRSITVEGFAPADGEDAGARALAGTTPSWATSAPVAAGDAVLVGADWGGDHETEVQVRADDGDGWTAWMDLHVDDEHQPDPGTEEAAGGTTTSDPIWVGRVDRLQFRTDADLDRLDVDLVDMAGDLETDPDVGGRGAAMAAPEAPFIRPRSYWGADESLRSGDVSYADDVRFSVIHHEGGVPRWGDPDSIDDGCRQSASAIRAIYEFHTKSRGWWDIAYNFVVDPCGHIWEGRAGGVDKAVIGAHAGGWNRGSVGVLALGTFQSNAGKPADPVTGDLVDGIERLLTWKLDLHHTDPRGTTREVSGGGSSRYTEGTRVDVPVLSAHQITNTTSCPGAGIMDRLFNGREASATPRSTYTRDVLEAGLPKAFDSQPARWVATEKGDRPDWDVRFTEPLDWSLRITDADGELVRATGGTADDHVQRTWDLRDANGDLVDAGTYTARLTASGDSGEITPVVTKLVVSPTVTRRQGGDRIATSVALSTWAFDAADTAIVASARKYPDALVSGPLAGTLGAPVLLTEPDDLPEEVEAEIERLGATTVHVIGGEAAVGADVQAELEDDLGDVVVERIGGADRFATAALVAERVLDGAPATEVLLSLGRHEVEDRAFPDALSAGAFGADLTLPVLLTDRDRLPRATREALAAMAPQDVTLFGGTAAITDGVEERVRDVSGATIERFAGATRYDTSRMAAEELLDRRDVPSPEEAPAGGEVDDAPLIDLIFASGGNWPDALGAGAAAARTDTVFLLAHPDDLDAGEATRSFLDRWDGRIGAANVAGGSVAVHGRVVTAIAQYVSTDETVESEPIEWPPDPFAGNAGATSEPTASPSPSVSPSPTASPSPTSSPSPTASPSPTPTP
jgi:hypothetical protein